MNTNLWKVNYNNYEEQIVECAKNCKKIIFLLDVCKNNFDLLEKVVYDIAIFHFKRLNIIFDPCKHFIEFWFKDVIFKNNVDNSMNINSFHCDCDENERKINKKNLNPLMSCVNYFNDNELPLLITNINFEEYKFKKFENKNDIQLVFPEKNKQVTFNGSNYHGVIDIFNKLNEMPFERYMLAINLWSKKPLNIEYYNNTNNNLEFNKETQLVTIEENNTFKELELNSENNIFNFDFYESILYNNKNFNIPAEIIDLVKNETTNGCNKNYKISYKKYIESSIKKNDNLSNLIKDIKLINTFDSSNNKIQPLDIFYNRFLQRFTYNKMFSKNVCEWIIFESEEYAKNNGGWTTRRHKNYPTTDIPVVKIKNIFNFVLFSFNHIFDKIKKSYFFTEEISFNICDLFVVKYNEQMQNKLDLHHDGSFLSINILLSDAKDFEGGGTYFDDGLTMFLEQGDLLVHSGKVKHAGLPITKGTRYIMVAFVEINVKLNNV